MDVDQEIWAMMPILESIKEFTREERFNFIMRLCKTVFETAYREADELQPLAVLELEHRLEQNGIKLIEVKKKKEDEDENK